MSENVYDAIKYLVSRKKVFYVHFRNVNRSVPKFHETFIDEGHVDMLKAMRIYKEEGFDGFFIDDHVPHMIDDTPYGHRGRAYAMGYIKALLHAVGAE